MWLDGIFKDNTLGFRFSHALFCSIETVAITRTALVM